MPETLSYNPEKKNVFGQLWEFVKGLKSNAARYLRRPQDLVRAVELAAMVAAGLSAAGCTEPEAGNQENASPATIERLAPRDISTSDVEKNQENAPANNFPEQAEQDNKIVPEASYAFYEAIGEETGISAQSIIDALHHEANFDNPVVIKQVNFCKEKGYLGVNLAVAADSSGNELPESLNFLVLKINDDKKLETIAYYTDADSDGQIVNNQPLPGISDQELKKLIDINPTYEGKVNTF